MLKPRTVASRENRTSFTTFINMQPAHQQFALKDFEVVQKLGQGGFGTVRLVRHKTTCAQYALKEIPKRKIDRKAVWQCVLAECDALQQLKHPLIISLFGAFQDQSYGYFVLELAEAGSLLEQVNEYGGYFPELWCRFYTAEVALAIAYVHAKGFVYRDLKMDNILIAANGHIKLADFGLATQLATRRTILVGTPHMLAPEVLLCQGVYSGSGDWWAVGLILCEMMLGRSPLHWVHGPEDLRKLPRFFKQQLHLPDWTLSHAKVSYAAKQVIIAFLSTDPEKRLCCTHGISELKELQWFDGVNFNEIEGLQVEAPLARLLRQKSLCTTSRRYSSFQRVLSRRRSSASSETTHSHFHVHNRERQSACNEADADTAIRRNISIKANPNVCSGIV